MKVYIVIGYNGDEGEVPREYFGNVQISNVCSSMEVAESHKERLELHGNWEHIEIEVLEVEEKIWKNRIKIGR